MGGAASSGARLAFELLVFVHLLLRASAAAAWGPASSRLWPSVVRGGAFPEKLSFSPSGLF